MVQRQEENHSILAILIFHVSDRYHSTLVLHHRLQEHFHLLSLLDVYVYIYLVSSSSAHKFIFLYPHLKVVYQTLLCVTCVSLLLWVHQG